MNLSLVELPIVCWQIGPHIIFIEVFSSGYFESQQDIIASGGCEIESNMNLKQIRIRSKTFEKERKAREPKEEEEETRG